jgi:hypothetical protein
MLDCMNEFIGYIDPGVGLLAWQALVAAFLGLVFYLKKTRTFVVGLVMKPFRKNKDTRELPGKGEADLEEVAR